MTPMRASRFPRLKSGARSAIVMVASTDFWNHVLPLEEARRLPSGRLRSELLVQADRKLRQQPKKFEAAPTVHGFHISGNTGDHIQRRIFLFGVWEPNLSRWMKRHLSPGDVVLDVGANIGYFSLLASKRVGSSGRVLAFEPVPLILEHLRRNLESNGVENVEVHPFALGDFDGDIEMFRGPDSNLGNSGTEAGESGSSVGAVRRRRGSDVVDRALWPSVRLIKIDVEGDELNVLRGFEELLTEAAPGIAVTAEMSPKWLKARGQSVAEAMHFMRQLGFVAFTMENSYAPEHYAFHRPARPKRLRGIPRRQTDVLFVKRR